MMTQLTINRVILQRKAKTYSNLNLMIQKKSYFRTRLLFDFKAEDVHTKFFQVNTYLYSTIQELTKKKKTSK